MASDVMVDWMIRRQCELFDLVDPYDPDLINPASLDLRLGDHLLIESCEHGFVRYDLSAHSQADPYELKPGQFVLAPSVETINLPPYLVGEVRLKSSMARRGLEHLNAGYCDPGWNGSKLTMELKNMLQLRCVPLWPGMRIVQIKLTKLAIMPSVGYAETGRYNGDQAAQVAKP
jgi:dCTP deaminase